MTGDAATDREKLVAGLKRARPRDLFLRWSGAIAAGLVLWAWLTGGRLLGRLSSERRWTNFKNFMGELTPAPVRASGNWGDAGPWAWDLFIDKGMVALLVTLAIACAAIILSSVAVTVLLPFSSRRLARANPMDVWSGRIPGWLNLAWGFGRGATRALFVLTRAIPEYIFAFLLIALLGLQAWPLVIALAIHNFGILGRLWGEVLENADGKAATQAIAAGSGRYATFGSVLLPALFNRFLIYFFYRWETCIKDATVLGMLGLLTLGKLIILSKGFFWDEMFFYVLLGSSVILVGDFFSTFLRRRLRNGGHST